MRINDLDLTFNSRAEEELENVREIYRNKLLACAKMQLESSLIEVKDSAEKIDVNFWKAALLQ